MRLECGGVLLHSVAQCGDRLFARLDLLECQLRMGMENNRERERERESETETKR